MNTHTHDRNTESNWRTLYRIAAVACVLIVLGYLLDIALTFMPSGSETSGTLTINGWFTLLQNNPFLALRNLGLLNVISLALMVPLYLAFYGVHRQVNPLYAALAAIIGFIGIAIYIANNPALPLLHLSDQFAAAATDIERTLYLAAGQALLARAEDFTPGSFLAFLIPSIGGMLMGWVMLRGGIFSKVTGWVMLLGVTFLIVFTVCATFIPSLFNAVMIFAMFGGILSIIGYGLIARRLFQLAAAQT